MKNAAAFFDFMHEREQVRIRKERGDPWPWTDDVILQTYKFTNVKRLNDRTTQAFKAIYDANRKQPKHIILMNCAVYRYFGTMEFARALGWQKTWHPTRIKGKAAEMMAAGQKVFTGAYVITNGGIKGPKYEVIVDHYLGPFFCGIMSIINVILKTNSWQAAAEAMYKMPGFGGTGFMTKEVLQDAILTPVLEDCTDRKTWSPCGPGARRGLNYVYGRPYDASISEATALANMREIWAAAHCLPKMQALDLDLHDIQFQLCEIFKHVKVAQGLGRPRSLYRHKGA